MENKRKHLEFIQAIISRMASNLFFLRGWTITLIGALLALFSKNNSPDYVFYFLIVIVLIFWILDGYFLSQERSYRDLYNYVRKLKEDDVYLCNVFYDSFSFLSAFGRHSIFYHISVKIKLWQEKFLSATNTGIQVFSIYHALVSMTQQPQGTMLMFCTQN